MEATHYRQQIEVALRTECDMRLFVGKVFHWQSPSTTSDNSPTEQRYVHHREKGTLFCCLCGKIRQTVSAKARGGVHFWGKKIIYSTKIH